MPFFFFFSLRYFCACLRRSFSFLVPVSTFFSFCPSQTLQRLGMSVLVAKHTAQVPHSRRGEQKPQTNTDPFF
ncbi:Uncharacterized protein APZ42_016968 [Daphnia magna]|uniref:Secreted protein n=1 Tax=Daphnia magna TaxID=35525 RepID=A0A165A9W0_9CRUS|nr:Uncharacterized protein APZ42_016968 [Daphnia magna]